jgi:hypothetical protein
MQLSARMEDAMTLFELLLIAHLVGDFLFQTEYQALHKAEGKFFNTALTIHCLTYTICFFPVFMLYEISAFWFFFIFWSHMFYDRRWPIIVWRRYVNRCSQNGIGNTFWLTVVIDQIFELLVLAVISIATVGIL